MFKNWKKFLWKLMVIKVKYLIYLKFKIPQTIATLYRMTTTFRSRNFLEGAKVFLYCWRGGGVKPTVLCSVNGVQSPYSFTDTSPV